MRRSLLLLAIGLAVSSLHAETYVVPVVTARMKDATYSTTTGFRNDSGVEVTCNGRYVRADGKVLSAVYRVPAGATLAEPDTLVEAAAVGTMQLDCSGELAIASRIQSSKDGGLTFDAGSVFAAGRLRTAVTAARPRTMQTSADLLVLEPDGSPATFKVVVKDSGGAIRSRRTYEIPAYAQQRVDMAAMRGRLEAPRVEIEVASGRVAVLVQVRDAAITQLAPEVSFEQRIITARNRSATATPSEAAPSATELLLLCPFKAAPFRDPAFGLCYMRDRWYDPATGTFLTPDPEGYADSSNLYAYCHDDPVNCSDPTGRSATVVGGLLGVIGGSGYTIYRSVRYGDPFTWSYIGQGALSGAAIGLGIDTLGAGAGLSASLLGGTAIGAGAGGAVASIQSSGDWTAYGKGALKGGLLGGIGGATGYGITAAGLSGGWAFAGSVAADTYAGVGVDYLFGDATTLSDTFAQNAVGSLAGNALGYGAKWLLDRSAARRPLTSLAFGDLTGFPTPTPNELQLITNNLRRTGVTVTVGGEAAAADAASHNARALFYPIPGQPGRIVIPEGAARVVVYEELVHALQHRRMNFWTTGSQSGRGLLEIEARDILIELAELHGWTPPELQFVTSMRSWYLDNMWKLRRLPRLP